MSGCRPPCDGIVWRERSGELAEWALARVFVRTDRYGGYYRDSETGKAKPINVPTKKDGGARPGALTWEIVANHFYGALRPESCIGAHSLRPDDSMGRVLTLDIDAHDGQPADPDANERFAWRVYATLKALGFRVLLVSSNGTGGFHLWVLFREYIQGAVLRAFGLWLTRDWKEHGVKCEPEVFPKQDFLKRDDGFGGWVRLPGRHHTKDHWSRAWDGERWLDAAATIDLILSLDGDDPQLIPLEALADESSRTPPKAERSGFTQTVGVSPGDDFSRRGTWAETGLFHEGGASWDRKEDEERGTVTRPGKESGVSGTVGLVKADRSGFPQFYCFSSNWPPFAAGKSYNRFGVYALLKHGGDYQATAADLRARGYGTSEKRSGGRSKGDAGGAPPASLDGQFDDTDVAAGRQFVADHGADVRYVCDWSRWAAFDGLRWEIDHGNTAVEHRGKLTAEGMAKRAADEVGEAASQVKDAKNKDAENAAKKRMTEATRRLGIAKRLQDMRNLGRMLHAARSEPAVHVRIGAETFNRRTWLFNVLNGTIDLRTGQLRPHQREDLLTQLCPVEFDPDAKCPRWEKFLEAIFAGDGELVGFVRRLIGSALVGEVTEHVLPIFWGGGANGKSVLIEVLLHVLGPDYAMKAPPGLFIAKPNESHPTERASLFGKRLVAAVETGQGSRLDETLVKELTGGDRITARRMRQDFWEFTPTHTAVMVTNHKPVVHGTDGGVWRRLRLVPFTVTFWNPDVPPKEGETRPEELRQDKHLRDKLIAEAPGILAWAVRACREWQDRGLGCPQQVMTATREYRDAQDQIGQFVAERCRRINDTAVRERGSKLYAAYKGWCESSGERWLRSNQFGPELERLGFMKIMSNGAWYLRIALQAESSGEDIPI